MGSILLPEAMSPQLSDRENLLVKTLALLEEEVGPGWFYAWSVIAAAGDLARQQKRSEPLAAKRGEPPLRRGWHRIAPESILHASTSFAQLQREGFVEIRAADGLEATVRLTDAGRAALAQLC